MVVPNFELYLCSTVFVPKTVLEQNITLILCLFYRTNPIVFSIKEKLIIFTCHGHKITIAHTLMLHVSKSNVQNIKIIIVKKLQRSNQNMGNAR